MLTTTSRTPPRASASRCQTISGLPWTSSSGFGVRVGQRPHALAAAGGEDHRRRERSPLMPRPAPLRRAAAHAARPQLGANRSIRGREQRLGARRVVAAEVADVDIERRRTELGPGVDCDMRLGEQHDAGDAVGGAGGRAPAASKRWNSSPTGVQAGRADRAAARVAQGVPDRSSPAGRRRSRAGRRSGAVHASGDYPVRARRRRPPVKWRLAPHRDPHGRHRFFRPRIHRGPNHADGERDPRPGDGRGAAGQFGPSRARRWAWPRWRSRCGAVTCATTRPIRTGPTATASCCRTATRRCCSTRCCT